MGNKLKASVALIAAGALALSACSAPEKKNEPGGSAAPTNQAGEATGQLTVLWNQFFYSLNANTSFGNNVTNANVAYSVGSSAWYYDHDLKMVKDESFMKYEKTSDSPLTIKQTIPDTATWSDGVPVRTCDMILQYGAWSAKYNTVDGTKQLNDDSTVKKNEGTQVYFDASSEALKLVKDIPKVADDGKSITYEYTKPYGDWEYALLGADIPAHIIGKLALGVSDPTAACDAVTKAFQDNDKASLAKISNVWNTSYNFTAMPANKDLLVTNGPYMIKDIKDKKSMTLTANPNYKGSRKPKIKDVTIVYNEDATASGQALQNGEVAVIQPQATQDLLKQLQGDSKLEVISSDQASYEHVDLTFNNGGPFDPKSYGGDAAKALKVRQAFLKTLPRTAIVDTLIKPLNPNAKTRDSFNLTPGVPAYDSTIAGNNVPKDYAATDVDGAKKLLADAGVASPTVRFLYAKSNPRRQNEFRLIKESAEKAGFKVIDGGSDAWSELLGGGKYDAALFAWSSNNDAVTGSAANFVTNGQNNYGGYSSKKVDELYTTLQTTVDKAEQDKIVTEVEKNLTDDAFGLPIFQFPNVTAYDKTKVKNISDLTFTPNYFWNIWEWELVK